jgi:hypothetical protein
VDLAIALAYRNPDAVAMPHASIKLIPGVDQNRTPALNEAAVYASQLIRFVPDRQGLGLIQKLGGWTKYYANAIGSVVRFLWAWEDTNATSHLAVGAESSLSVITNGALSDITPETRTDDAAVDIDTIIADNTIVINAVGLSVSPYWSVYLPVHISVGGIVLFGMYQCYNVGLSADVFEIEAADAPTAAVTGGGAVPEIDTTSGSATALITLADHGLAVGDTFPILVSTDVGGVTFYGNYLVRTVPTSGTFTITAATTATSTTSGFVNGGDARFVFYATPGMIPVGTGYGAGGYGSGGYGSGSTITSTATPITANDWCLDNWGEILVANPFNGAIYYWSPTSGDTTAIVIQTAPVTNYGIIVAMPQRQIIAWGTTFTSIHDPLLIRWCDVNNFDVWIGTVSNQAGSYRIPKGSRIVQCIQAAQQTLIWTDLGLWAMQYVGLPYVYQFNELGNGVGLIGRKAATSMSGVVYWMGQSQFYRFGQNGPEPIPCPVWDVAFQEIDMAYVDNIRIAANSRFGEISWYIPTIGSGGVPTIYLKYNTLIGQWDYGSLTRTAWINESVLGAPIAAGTLPGGTGSYIVQHETSTDGVDVDGNPSAIVSVFNTGFLTLNDADLKMFVDQIWPDMKWGYFNGDQTAQVFISFEVCDYPGQTPLVYGPYAMTQSTTYITPRFRGRLVSIKIESNDVGSFWRIGNIRYRVQPDGKF